MSLTCRTISSTPLNALRSLVSPTSRHAAPMQKRVDPEALARLVWEGWGRSGGREGVEKGLGMGEKGLGMGEKELGRGGK